MQFSVRILSYLVPLLLSMPAVADVGVTYQCWLNAAATAPATIVLNDSFSEADHAKFTAPVSEMVFQPVAGWETSAIVRDQSGVSMEFRDGTPVDWTATTGCHVTRRTYRFGGLQEAEGKLNGTFLNAAEVQFRPGYDEHNCKVTASEQLGWENSAECTLR